MAIYPRLVARPYSGNDKGKQIEYEAILNLAGRIEEYMAARMSEGEVRTFHASDVARDLGASEEWVRDIFSYTTGDPRAITVRKTQE